MILGCFVVFLVFEYRREEEEEARERNRQKHSRSERARGATGNIVALKKKTKLGKIVPHTILREISIFFSFSQCSLYRSSIWLGIFMESQSLSIFSPTKLS